MGKTRYKFYENNYPYFLTCSVISWLPIFSNTEAAKQVLDSLVYLQTEKRISLFGYVILENHMHLIASAKDLSKEISSFKSFTARRIIDHLDKTKNVSLLKQLEFSKLAHRKDRNYQLWQEGSHPQQIQSDKMMIQKLEYVHENPVRRGCVDDPAAWRYSSARNYQGMDGLIPVCTEWGW